MRILQVSTSDHLGGAESSAWNLFQAYCRRGHASWLAVGRKVSDDPDVFLIPNDLVWTRFWRRVQNRVSGTRAARLSRLAGLLARLPEMRQVFETQLGRENFDFPGTYRLLQSPPQPPDIVHCHNLHGNYLDLRALPWLSRQVPVILNLRDAWLLSGHCAHSFACERWKTGCGQCPDLTIYPAIKRDATAYNWRRKRDIYARSRLYITTPSQWLMQRVQHSMLHGVGYRVIPNGIDLTIFHPGDQIAARACLGLPLEPKIVLYAARGGSQSPWRDYRAMELAMRQVAAAYRNELLLVCLGQAREEKELVFGRLRIQFPAFERDPRRMALYYQAADVYILVALAETFSRTITEAMACGTPVVATAVGGIPEQIENGRTGFLVPLSDTESMTEVVRLLLVNENLRRKMGDLAADHVKHRFGLDRQVDDFLNWYKEVRQDWLAWRSDALSNPEWTSPTHARQERLALDRIWPETD